MRDRVSTSGAGLFSNPRFWDAPSLGQFFRCQYFEEWSSSVILLCSDCSPRIIWCLHFNDLRCPAVHKSFP